MPAKNLLMFSIDDLRTLDNWGHFRSLVHTPNLDRLAGEGTTFERTVSQVPLCNPSRASVFTGQQPTETGVLDNNVLWYERVNVENTLPAVLRTAGAYVAMFGKNFHEDPIGEGRQAVMFDEFLFPNSDGNASQVIHDDVYHSTPFRSGRYGGSPDNLRDEQTVDAALDFLQNRAEGLDKPFLLGVGIYRPHLDWWVPSKYYDLYDQGEIRAALDASLADGTILPGQSEYSDVPPMSGPSGFHKVIGADKDLWVDYIHAYLASVSYADAKVGQVLDALEANPRLAADTAILLWSDHGYHLGDHDRWQKFTHWHEATQAPMIVVDPDAPGGQVAQQVVGLVDIFPTVFDLMGLRAPSYLKLSGNSLLPIVRDVDIDWYDPGAGKGVELTTIYGSVSIRADVPGVGDLRYTLYPDGTEELYDLTRDPGEHTNRLHYATGEGLTPRDDDLRAIMDGLMDQKLAEAGILLSNGRHPVIGTGADELLVTTNGSGTNALQGGGGNDTYLLYQGASITEAAGGGFDSIVLQNNSLAKGFKLPAHVEMIQVPGGFTGNDADNWIFSIGGDGTLKGLGGGDTIRTGPGGMTADGGDGSDDLIGDKGRDILLGGRGADTLTGWKDNDSLVGGAHDDLLLGRDHNDTLAGGAGADVLNGGGGRDVFDFNATGESSMSAWDVIVGFEGFGAKTGDQIDLSGIDANKDAPGNQSFALGGSGVGHLHVFNNLDGSTVILARTDSDYSMDLRIDIKDGAAPAVAYTAEDFIL